MEVVALLLLPKSPFGQAFHRTTINHIVEGDFTTVKNRTIETDSGQYGGKQDDKWNSGVSGKQSSGSKPGSLVEKMCRIDSRRISNKCSPLSKKFVHRKNPKQNAIGRKISSFQKELGKIDPRSGNFICSKGVCDIILETSSTKDYSKTGGNVQNTGIVNRSGDYGNAGQRNHKKVQHQLPDLFLSLLVKKKG